MADDFKRAQMQANANHCGPDCCGGESKRHGQARATLKITDADMRAFAYEWREEFEWLSKN